MFAIDLFDFGRGGTDFASILKRERISKSLRTPGLVEPIWPAGSIISNDLVDVVAHNSNTEEELNEIEEFEESTEVYKEDQSI